MSTALLWGEIATTDLQFSFDLTLCLLPFYVTSSCSSVGQWVAGCKGTEKGGVIGALDKTLFRGFCF